MDPHISVVRILWVATEPQPHTPRAALCSMLGPLLLAKYLFLFCPQASSCVDKVKISQSMLRANETFVIMQLISPVPGSYCFSWISESWGHGVKSPADAFQVWGRAGLAPAAARSGRPTAPRILQMLRQPRHPMPDGGKGTTRH